MMAAVLLLFSRLTLLPFSAVAVVPSPPTCHTAPAKDVDRCPGGPPGYREAEVPATTAVARTGPLVPAKPLPCNTSQASRGKTTRHVAIARRAVVVLFETSTMRGKEVAASTCESVFDAFAQRLARCTRRAASVQQRCIVSVLNAVQKRCYKCRRRFVGQIALLLGGGIQVRVFHETDKRLDAFTAFPFPRLALAPDPRGIGVFLRAHAATPRDLAAERISDAHARAHAVLQKRHRIQRIRPLWRCSS